MPVQIEGREHHVAQGLRKAEDETTKETTEHLALLALSEEEEEEDLAEDEGLIKYYGGQIKYTSCTSLKLCDVNRVSCSE